MVETQEENEVDKTKDIRSSLSSELQNAEVKTLMTSSPQLDGLNLAISSPAQLTTANKLTLEEKMKSNDPRLDQTLTESKVEDIEPGDLTIKPLTDNTDQGVLPQTIISNNLDEFNQKLEQKNINVTEPEVSSH